MLWCNVTVLKEQKILNQNLLTVPVILKHLVWICEHVESLMIVMRPCAAAVKEPKVILWACSCKAVPSMVK